MRARVAAVTAAALLVAACGEGTTVGAGGPDLLIERRTGYAVVVDDAGGTVEIGFSTDRDAQSGTAFDVSAALWRIDDGPWNEPPASCIGRGQRIELGVTSVQNESRPGLLSERVVWLSCLAPTDG